MNRKKYQIIRLWFNYLKVCLQYPEMFNVDKEIYKSWHLSSVKKDRYDVWIKSHKHLFGEISDKVQVVSKSEVSKKHINLKVPVHMKIEDAMTQIQDLLESRIDAEFNITNERFRYLEVDDYLKHFKLRYEHKHKQNILEKYTYIGTRIYNQQLKSVAKRMKSASTKMISRDKFVAKNPDDFTDEVYLRMIKRKVDTATKILDNVASGRFTGDYT